MTNYVIRYNRTSDHIEGLKIRTAGSELDYSLSACGALSRGASKMAYGFRSDDLSEVLARAGRSRKFCATCKAAAEAMQAQ